MSILTWQIPITLPSPNSKEHWRTTWARNKLIKEYIDLLWLNTKDKPQLPITITLTRIASRSLDYDNLVYSLKGTKDVVASLFLPELKPGMADGDTRFTWKYNERKGKREGFIEIELT